MQNKQSILEKKLFCVPNITDLKDMLYKSATKFKNKFAFKLKDTTGKIYGVTYEKFKNDVEALGTSIAKLGLIGKSICVIGKNSYNWAVSYITSSILGTVVPLDKELHPDDIINFINVSESSAIIGDDKFISTISTLKNSLINTNLTLINMSNSSLNIENCTNFNYLLSNGAELINNNDFTFRNIQINPDDTRILLFTSGTTGNAKGVCLSHKNICSNIMSIAQTVKVDPSVTVLSILPIHHTYECTIGFLLVLYGGGTITYCDGLRHIQKNIEEYKPSFILCVPLLLENVHTKIMKTMKKSLPEKYFLNNNPVMDNIPLILRPIVKYKIKKSLGGNMKTFIVGAASLNPTIVESFFKLGIKVLQGYGLTECSPLVAGNNDFFHKADSVGMPIPNVEYKIYNPDSDGCGEIIVKGPNVMKGYFKDEEATKKALVNDWFHTGDVGRIDDDGFLYITGRCKSVIVTKNGKNIYPEEIEYFLNDNQFISEALVYGVNSDTDTVVNAKLLPNMEAICEKLNTSEPSNEEVEEIISNVVKEINSRFPNYKHIKSFKILKEALEKTTTQKIKRYGSNME